MKAVIPAAGLGTRFLPATKAIPKEMVPVVDRPVIQYVIEEAVSVGITDILIVTSDGKKAMKDHFIRSDPLERFLEEKGKDDLLSRVVKAGDLADIEYVVQNAPRGLGDAIAHGRDFVGDEHFTVMLPDEIYASERPGIGQLMDVHDATGGSVLALERIPMEQTPSYGIAEAHLIEDRTYTITGVVEKPAPADARSDLAVMGRYLLPPEIFDAFESVKPGFGNEIQLIDTIQSLLGTGKWHGILFEGKRYDTGTVEGWLEANLELALASENYSPGARELVKRNCPN